jgi:hypothetical protein
MSRAGLVSQALGILLPPGAGFVLGYVLAGYRPAAEGLRALAGLILMFVSACAVCFFRRRREAGGFFKIRGRAKNLARVEKIVKFD